MWCFVTRLWLVIACVTVTNTMWLKVYVGACWSHCMGSLLSLVDVVLRTSTLYRCRRGCGKDVNDS